MCDIFGLYNRKGRETWKVPSGRLIELIASATDKLEFRNCRKLHPHRSIPPILPPPSKYYQLTIFKPAIAKFLMAASFVTSVTPSASA